MIFAAGTGNPFFTTDTAAALRAAEIDAEVLLKGTHSGVDGVYDADPRTIPAPRSTTRSRYMDVMTKDLKVMDATAIAFCRDNGIPIVVFDMSTPGSLRAIRGEGRHASGPSSSGTTDRRSVTLVGVIEETLLEAIDKMDKAVAHVQSQFQTVRTGPGRSGPGREASPSILRHPGAAAAAGLDPGARGPSAARHVRTTAARWARSRRRSATPTSASTPSNDGSVIRLVVPAAHRGAPQGVRQGRQAHGRGRPGRRAQPAP